MNVINKIIKNPSLVAKFINEVRVCGIRVALHKARNHNNNAINIYGSSSISMLNNVYGGSELLDDVQYSIDNYRGDIAFTIVSKNYLHVALTLRNSFLKNNPDHKFVIWIVDMITDASELRELSVLSDGGVDFIFWHDVVQSHKQYHFEQMFFKYSIMEMNTAIKPFILEHYIRTGYKKIYYIDPDICFYSPIITLQKALDDYDIVLTPHMMSPYEDDKKPSEQDILQAGSYNLGFIAIKSSLEALKLCVWWKQKLFQACFVDLQNGLFVDQKWMDLTPSLFNNVFILKDYGHNVAYWNIHERTISKKDDVYFVNNDKLVFFHFSGLTFEDVSLISKHQNRFNLSMLSKEYNELFVSYSHQVKNNNSVIFKKMKYYYNYLFSTEVSLPNYLRRTILERLFISVCNPFVLSEAVHKKACDVFSEQFDMIKRYYWQLRSDLQIAFPDIQNNQVTLEGYNNWWSINNAKDELLDKRLYLQDTLTESFLGVTCVGYLELQTGVAEVSRSFVRNLLKNGIALNLVNIGSEHHSKISNVETNYFNNYYGDKLYKNQIFFINADQINNVVNSLEHLTTNDHLNRIGVFWWEFNDYFYFEEAFRNLSKVVVFTDFIKSAVEKQSPPHVDVIKLLYPYQILDGVNKDNLIARNFFNLNNINLDEDFIFYFNFDMRSCFERKNPLAVLEAFSIVSLNNESVKLILKISNVGEFLNEISLIEEFINLHKLSSNVVIDTATYERECLLSIMKNCNCYVSLHRSEGLGLGILDAMSLGLPVIATNYGGNTDFMNSENSILIDYSSCEVQSDFGAYRKGYIWAEPDVNHAAKEMQRLVDNNALAEEIGCAASLYIRNTFSDINLQKDIYKFMSSLYE